MGNNSVNVFGRFLKLMKILRHRRHLRALVSGVAAGVEHEAILSNLDCQTVVDVGANRGQFALMARQSFPNAKIYSFEPLANPAAKYRAVFKDDPSVQLYEVAIGPEERETTIHLSLRDDSSSLLPITALQNQIFPGTAASGVETIQMAPLSKFVSANDITRSALLKLDVQGFELPALEGCEDILSQFTYVYVECSFVELYEGQAFADEVIAWLRERGFRLKGAYNLACNKQGEAVQMDILFASR